MTYAPAKSDLLDAIGAPCPYCGHTMLLNSLYGRRGPTCDHVFTPRSHGGRLEGANRIIVCQRCNGDKADRSLGDWYLHLRRRVDPRAVTVAATLDRLAPNLRPMLDREAS